MNIVLYEPEIPPNTGNIARTCAATGATLHLIEPLGFSLSDRYLKRAGLDYWNQMVWHTHTDWGSFTESVPGPYALLTTKATKPYTAICKSQAANYATNAGFDPAVPLSLVFGPETRGLPDALLARYPEDRYRIPMLPGRRSINLSNAVAIVVYHLLEQSGFPGMA